MCDGMPKKCILQLKVILPVTYFGVNPSGAALNIKRVNKATLTSKYQHRRFGSNLRTDCQYSFFTATRFEFIQTDISFLQLQNFRSTHCRHLLFATFNLDY